MKKAEIISVGTELLMGQVANTDAQYISALLPGAGFACYYHTVVGDNRERLSSCLRNSLERSDLVILTGGLGPTEDDLTKKTVADVLGLKLVEDEKTVSSLVDYFSKRGSAFIASNLSQAYFPENSYILENDFGTAPGCLIRHETEKGQKIVVLLPGPPSELNPMFSNKVLPVLKGETDDCLKSKFFAIAGVPESLVEDRLKDIISGRTNPTAATYVKEGIVTVRVSASGTSEEADRLIEETSKIVRERFSKELVSEDKEPVEEVLVRLCEKENITFSCAESCTGGMIAALVTSVPGASNVIKGGIVTYSNEAKINLLGVPKDVIDTFGAVSMETAKAMAENARIKCGTDIAVSATGNAGPGTMENKAAGLVYIGVSYKGKTFAKEFNFKGSRDHVRRRAANMALNMARRMILGTLEE